MSAPITIRDRRYLPFFMVRLRALQEIRNNVSGPRRARALGLYVRLCQIANEQRSEGDHVRLVATCKDLARRGAIGTSTLKVLSTALDAAGAAEFKTRLDALRGTLPSLISLRVQDGAWVALTVTAANRLAHQSRGALLPTLGLLSVLFELCDEQREALGGQWAETARADVARRVGCSTDTLDTWVKALERADILHVTRRRGADGGHLPNVWGVQEPQLDTPAEHDGDPDYREPATDSRRPVTPMPTLKLCECCRLRAWLRSGGGDRNVAARPFPSPRHAARIVEQGYLGPSARPRS